LDDGIVVFRRVSSMRDTMAAAPRLMTVEDYFATPETVLPAELAFGVLRVADSPTPRHQSAVLELSFALMQHVRERRLGRIWVSPLDVVLDEKKALIVQPDLMFISNERSYIVRDRVRGAPDLVIEVLSPNPRIGRTSEHLRWFAEYGVRECWLVHQDRKRVTVTGFRGGKQDAQRIAGEDAPIRSSVLPDFALSLREILEA
jgi:Uma2 family endonuclease